MNQDIRQVTSRLEKRYAVDDIEQYVALEFVQLEKEDDYSLSKLYSRSQDTIRAAMGVKNGIYITRYVWERLKKLEEHGFTDVVPDVDELKEIFGQHVTKYQRQTIVQAMECSRPFSDNL